MCCLRPILHWREIGFRVHLLVCSRRLNTTIWKSYILQNFYTFSGGDVNSLTKVHNSKWSTLKRTSSMPGNMNFMETGILRWNFTFNNSLVGSNACNIAPWKLNIKVECPISLLPIAYCILPILSVALFPMPAILHHPSSISKSNAQYRYCPLPLATSTGGTLLPTLFICSSPIDSTHIVWFGMLKSLGP